MKKNISIIICLLFCLSISIFIGVKVSKTLFNSSNDLSVENRFIMPEVRNTDSSNTDGINYKYNKDVILLSEENLIYVLYIGDNSITFSKDTPAQFVPKSGYVLTSGVNDTFPHGLGVKVTDICISTNGDIVCTIIPAALNEIFEELHIDTQVQIIGDENDEVVALDKDGNAVKLKVVRPSLNED